MTDKLNRPYSPDHCRTRILQLSRTVNPETIEPGVRGALIGALNKILASDGNKEKGDGKRHVVLGWLFGDPEKRLIPISAKQLTDGQWFALAGWMKLSRTVDAKWLPVEDFKTECLWVLATALKKYHDDETKMLTELGFNEDANG